MVVVRSRRDECRLLGSLVVVENEVGYIFVFLERLAGRLAGDAPGVDALLQASQCSACRDRSFLSCSRRETGPSRGGLVAGSDRSISSVAPGDVVSSKEGVSLGSAGEVSSKKDWLAGWLIRWGRNAKARSSRKSVPVVLAKQAPAGSSSRCGSTLMASL